MTTCYANELINTFNISITNSITFLHPTLIHLNVPITKIQEDKKRENSIVIMLTNFHLYHAFIILLSRNLIYGSNLNSIFFFLFYKLMDPTLYGSVIPELANISGLGNEIAKVAYVCFMYTSEAYQLIYEFQLYCGFHQPSSDN